MSPEYRDPVGEFLDAGTEYILAIIDARLSEPKLRLNPQVLSAKAKLRDKLEQLLNSTQSR